MVLCLYYKQNYLLLKCVSQILQKYGGEMSLYHAKLAPNWEMSFKLLKKIIPDVSILLQAELLPY